MVEKGVLLMEIKAIKDLCDLARDVVDYKWGVEFDAALKRLEAEIAERFMELPVDADGEPIHVGDRMIHGSGDEVYAFALGDDKAYFTDNHANVYHAYKCRHVHPPTVDGLLREFGDWYAHTKGGCDKESIIAEYAAKFELKEENA